MARRSQVNVAAMLSICEAAPMTRAEIARRTGLSRAHVSMLANGSRGLHRPAFDTVQAIKQLADTVGTLTIVSK